MITHEAIQALAESESISAAAAAMLASCGSAVALPQHYTVHDLEKFGKGRRRLRGKMTTEALADFAAYVGTNAEPGATVFVDSQAMQARAVLNLGTPNAPGHADNVAVLAMPQTAAYKALLRNASGQGLPQRQAAEFLEDWHALAGMSFSAAGGDNVPAAQAIAAVRAITVEKARKIEATEQSLGATRSAFESVQASSRNTLPETVTFTCHPHAGLAKRTFALRLGVLTSGDAPQVVLRIVNVEQHQEDMAAELAQLVRGSIAGLPVVVGTYAAAG